MKKIKVFAAGVAGKLAKATATRFESFSDKIPKELLLMPISASVKSGARSRLISYLLNASAMLSPFSDLICSVRFITQMPEMPSSVNWISPVSRACKAPSFSRETVPFARTPLISLKSPQSMPVRIGYTLFTVCPRDFANPYPSPVVPS